LEACCGLFNTELPVFSLSNNSWDVEGGVGIVVSLIVDVVDVRVETMVAHVYVPVGFELDVRNFRDLRFRLLDVCPYVLIPGDKSELFFFCLATQSTASSLLALG
jgi:hypothetical protein